MSTDLSRFETLERPLVITKAPEMTPLRTMILIITHSLTLIAVTILVIAALDIQRRQQVIESRNLNIEKNMNKAVEYNKERIDFLYEQAKNLHPEEIK